MALEWALIGLTVALTVALQSLVLFVGVRLLEPRLKRYGKDMVNLAKAQAKQGIAEAVSDIEMPEGLEDAITAATDENGKLDVGAIMQHPLAQQFLAGKSGQDSPLAGFGGGGLGEIFSFFQMMSEAGGQGLGGRGPMASSPGRFAPGIRR